MSHTELDDEIDLRHKLEDDIAALHETVAQQAAHIAQLEQAVAQARDLLTTMDWSDWIDKADDWLAANPAPDAKAQP